MSTEQNQPEPQSAPEFAPPAASNGEGGSDNHGNDSQGQRNRFRRRRRRRKPGGQPVGQQANGGVAISAGADTPPAEGAGEGQPEGEPAQRQQSVPQQNQNQNQNQNPNQNGDGRRRRKKKGGKRPFSGGQQASGGQPGNRERTHQPGNNFGGGQGRRQKKTRGTRAFVGPMDHSYRATNGNYAEAPPSTIQVNGNQGGGRGRRNAAMNDTGHQSQFLPTYYEPKPPAIAEDAPVKVYCFIEDLFVTAKITEAARKLGVKIAFVKGEKDDVAMITDAPEEERAHLILFDLNNVNAKPMTLIPKIRTKLKKTVSIVGFLSHLQGDLKAKAIEAGCDSVMPRAAFSQALPGLLRRYGLEEDTESQDSQHAYF